MCADQLAVGENLSMVKPGALPLPTLTGRCPGFVSLLIKLSDLTYCVALKIAGHGTQKAFSGPRALSRFRGIGFRLSARVCEARRLIRRSRRSTLPQLELDLGHRLGCLCVSGVKSDVRCYTPEVSPDQRVFESVASLNSHRLVVGKK